MDIVSISGAKPVEKTASGDDNSKKIESKKADEKRMSDEAKKKQREDEILNPVDKSLISKDTLGQNIAQSILSSVLG